VLKTISALKARQNLGQVMNEVSIRGDDYIIERAGKPLVAIIPIEKYQRLQDVKDGFFKTLDEIQAKTVSVPEAEIDEAIAEAVEAARRVNLED
jgi:prevent-host-death family protein